jgi:hypothetical protein
LSACGSKSDSQNKLAGNIIIKYEEDTFVFANPDRGFYIPKEWNSENDSPLNDKKLETIRDFYKTSLIMAEYKFHGYQNQRLSDKWLSLIKENFDTMRRNGFKCILRFAYTDDTLEKPWDADESTVLEHISQLKPLLQTNADVISTMQAGFIGVWGEWYYSSYFGFPDADYTKRKKVIEALLDALPACRMIAVRTPALKMGVLDLSEYDTLTASEAYGNKSIARIAHHNDAFLSTYNDMGTYDNLKADKNYLEHDSKYLAVGGETDMLSSYSKKDNALKEMARFHWSYLNMVYHPDVIKSWKTQGCFNEIARRLGYRFRLIEGEYTENPKSGSDFDICLEIANDGFAAPFNAHDVKFVLKNKSTGGEIVVNTNEDPRFWFGGGIIEVSNVINIDSRFVPGDYDLYIAITDPCDSLRENPFYNIRFANKGIWNTETGYNFLFTISIK